MKRIRAGWRAIAPAIILATVVVLATASPASAHERRDVGAFKFTVGWGDEPAFAVGKNSVQLILADANGPVTDVTDTIKVVVSTGDQTMPEMTVRPAFRVGAFGTPGDYRAYMFPSRPGTYTFHFTGTIHGQAIDEKFTSSATTFGNIEDPAAIAFPVKDPSVGQLADKVAAVEARPVAKSEDSKGLAIAGIALGAVALVVSVVSVTRKRTA
jgi:hypothetical protein